MFSRWLHLGIRTQIMIIVMIGTVLTTAVTLLIADSSIQNYASVQIKDQETNNLDVAYLVLKSQYGDSISISSTNQMVIDSPNINNQTYDANNLYGKLPLNINTAYVDQVHALLKGNEVSVYQCANQNAQLAIANGQLICPQISTTFLAHDARGNLITVSVLDPSNNQQKTLDRDVNSTGHTVSLPQDAISNMKLTLTPQRFTGQEQIGGTAYIASYRPLFDPQNHLIGVLAVAEPLTSVTSLINNTSLELIISCVVVMLALIIIAVLIASAISTTLQRASTQLSTASTQLSNISGQQAGGSRQQVWAINAINQALRNLQETSTDVSRRTDQLAQIGSQVAMRRAEISPAQFESVMGYMTRSVRDISVASHQQTTTIERMSGAMQAVVEIADQVAGTSQQTSESAKRLDQVVGALKRLVAGRGQEKNRETLPGNRMNQPDSDMAAGGTSGGLSSRDMPNNMPTSNAPSRPRNSDMAMPNAGRLMADAARPGYGARPANAAPPANNRPMLPGPQRAQPQPPMREQGGWDRNRDDYSTSRNNQTDYGAQAPWSDYGRNQE